MNYNRLVSCLIFWVFLVCILLVVSIIKDCFYKNKIITILERANTLQTISNANDEEFIKLLTK